MLFRTLSLVCLLFAIPMQAQANKLLMPGDVIKGHAKEEEFCEKCHKKFDKAAQSRMCMDCHKDVGKDVDEKKGYHGRMEQGKECKECHPDHKGRDAKVAEFDHKKFDHKLTDYVLKGGHLGEKAKCDSCHKADKKFRDAPSYCNECHKKDDKHKGGLGTDCGKCHVDKDWKTTEFDHDKTKFKLLGKHIEVKCVKCHIDNKFKDTPKTCVACHKKDDEKAHKGKLGPDCAKCHGEKDWKTTKFDHDKTDFKLLGKHVEVKCAKCHIDNKYKDTPKLCNACHKKDDDKAHKGKFGPKCETCHNEKDWKEILFDHDKKTKFPLLGKHRAPVKCTACHKGDLYKDKLLMTCVSCHKKDDDKAHKGNFGPKCESCHTEKDWKEILFDHDKKTKFPLLGKHRAPLKCSACHKGDLYKDKLAMDCFSCHEKDDKHKTQEGKKCETCHGAESWFKTTFDHQRMSKYPLLGRHVLVACKKCHLAPTFKDASKECMGCHEKDDVHKRRLGTECQLCHSTRSWQAWDFDHNKTNFKLDGPHKKTAQKCYSCHSKPMAKQVVTSTACGSCHDREDVHNGNFGDRCDRCHDGNDWKQIRMGVVIPDKGPKPGNTSGASKK
ncbi:MAG: cytochrome C [Sideroxyarcus sp.]|nr:cytochrome C [Sideroxyarcus sp.]